jgi:predicted CXXCH cytochrome family protein
MQRTQTAILWLLLAWGCFTASTTQALDPPHDAGQSIDCSTCHITHHAPGGAITKIAGNPNLCMSCHSAGGLASGQPFADTDEAIPGIGGSSHRWDSGASGWVKTNPANTSSGTVQSGGSFNGRYRKAYTITIKAAGDVGTALFDWSTSKPVSQTYRDEFTAIAYNGTNGTQDWSVTPWQEIGETDGPGAGVVRVVSNAACASGNCLRIGGGTISTRGVSRAANISGGTSAMLTFSYQRQLATCPNTSTANVALQVSNDGATWITLATYNLNACDSSQVAQAFDITPYITAATQIRFLAAGTAGATDLIYIDNVQVEYLVAGGGATNITTGTNVALDEGITVTFANGTPSPSFKLNDQWTVYANTDINQPASFALAARMISGKVTCSTCHNEHSQIAEPFDPAAPAYPALGPGGAGRHFQRLDDDINQMCVDCHSTRNVTASSQGSHPVGVPIPATGFYKNP